MSEPIQQRRRGWVEKWLMLATSHHPKLAALANTLHAFCSDMWEFPSLGMLLVLCGPNGCGKTKSALAVNHWVNTVGSSKPVSVKDGHVEWLDSYFAHWPGFMDETRDGASKLIEKLIAAPVLILDEVGGDHDPSQFGVTKLSRILSERDGKWTIVTTNIPPANWADAFDVRVESRLHRNSWVIDLDGVPDYSLVKKGALLTPGFTPAPPKYKPSHTTHRDPHDTSGYINLEFPCCFCGKVIHAKADPIAGQEWIDKFTRMTACNSCADGRRARMAHAA